MADNKREDFARHVEPKPKVYRWRVMHPAYGSFIHEGKTFDDAFLAWAAVQFPNMDLGSDFIKETRKFARGGKLPDHSPELVAAG